MNPKCKIRVGERVRAVWVLVNSQCESKEVGNKRLTGGHWNAQVTG